MQCTCHSRAEPGIANSWSGIPRLRRSRQIEGLTQKQEQYQNVAKRLAHVQPKSEYHAAPSLLAE
jgi:hypothetical protein